MHPIDTAGATSQAHMFRKKPVVIAAYQLPPAGQDVPDSFHEWCEAQGFTDWESGRDETLIITTLEDAMTAQPGDWIIKGVKGEFYPCKPDIFAATYEPAAALAAPGERPETFKHWCETCEGLGTIDETLGGEHFSNPKAKCPDCDGHGYWISSAAPGERAPDWRADANVMIDSLPERSASSQCPLCGWEGHHEHSPREITIYRNGVKYGARNRDGRDDSSAAQDERLDASGVGGAVRSGTHEHHEHRDGKANPDREDDHRDSGGDGLQRGGDVPAQEVAAPGERAPSVEKVMEQAQVFASSWALVGGRFDQGNEIDNANEQKDELLAMVAALASPALQAAAAPAAEGEVIKHRLMHKVGDSWLPASEFLTGLPDKTWVAKAHELPGEWRIDYVRRWTGTQIANGIAEALAAPAQAEKAGVMDLRDAMWLDPQCADRGACQSLVFKALHAAPTDAEIDVALLLAGTTGERQVWFTRQEAKRAILALAAPGKPQGSQS